MAKHITFKQIAETCGCSVATVGRYMQNQGYVSKDKQLLIEQAMTQLGYVKAAQFSAKQIALFMHYSDHPLFGRLADAISHEALAFGYHTTVIHIDDSYDAASMLEEIKLVCSNKVSGIIINSLSDVIDFMSIRHELQALTTPIVMLERVSDIYNINKVLVNAEEGLFKATQCLYNAGHRSICFFTFNPIYRVEKMRVNGFKTAVQNFNIEQNCPVITVPSYKADDGYQAIRKYLESKPLPTAIIAADVLMAGFLQYFYELGIRVPQDISLVGLDDTYSEYLSPKLTTVCFPEKEMSKAAVNMILDKGNYPTAREIIFSPWLKERNSVTAPRKQEG